MIYPLSVITMVLWGIIAYKIWNFRSDDPENSDPATPVSHSMMPSRQDTLRANYRDPFLGERSSQSDQSSTPVLIPAKNSRPPKTAPSIVWSGTLRKHGTSYYLVTLNDTSHMIRAGETIGAFTLRQEGPDSIIFQQGSYRYTVKQP